jgi:hypothetical protein
MPRLAVLRHPLALGLAWVLSGCQPGATPEAGPDTSIPAAPTPEPADLAGAVRLDDAWLKIRPFVAHSARMDLFTQCLNRRDDEEKAGKTPQPLCFDYVKRDRSALATVRIELGHPSVGDAVAAMRAGNESAHFGIEKNGSHYQYLDLVYANRRADAYQRGEIRIIAAGPDGRKHAAPLVAELVRLFPAVTVEHVEKQP